MLRIGFLIVGFAAFLFVYEYASEKKKRADEYSGALELLRHVSSSLEKEALPLDKILSLFNPESEFAAELRNLLLGAAADEKNGTAGGDGGFRRERIVKLSSRLDETDEKLICGFFADFGRAGIEYEKERAKKALDGFEKRAESEAEKAKKDIKVARLLFATAFVGAMILIV